MAYTWLIKVILAHLLTDFIFQPKTWIKERHAKHFRSGTLYLHGLLTALVAWTLTGWNYWPAALVILVTHIAIDAWKSYRKDSILIFLADQLLHLAVLLILFCYLFNRWDIYQLLWHRMNQTKNFWFLLTAFVFLTMPAGIFIGQFTKKWREKIKDAEGLADAGKWIGICERIIILIFVLLNQYAAIGLLVAAKGIIRFNEKDRPEEKTEYLVIGTLISMGVAIVTGLLIKSL
ncbi:MAG: DUF3307 domain-containing protein [Puia sp.]